MGAVDIKAASEWTLALKVSGLDAMVVKDICEAYDMPRPSQMPESRRARLLERLLANRPMHAAFVAARRQLIAEVKAIPHRERVRLAGQAGCVDSRGRVVTAPSELSAKQLWTILSLVPAPPRDESQDDGVRCRCEDCGRRFFGTRAKCPGCRSPLVVEAL